MGISVTKLLIVLAIIVVIFGTKRLKNVGGDLGAAIKSFKNAMNDEEAAKPDVDNKNASDDAASKKSDNS